MELIACGTQRACLPRSAVEASLCRKQRGRTTQRVSAVLTREPSPSPTDTNAQRKKLAIQPETARHPRVDPSLTDRLNSLLVEDAAAGDAASAAHSWHSGASTAGRTPGPRAGPATSYYFAYGANLSRDTLQNFNINVLSRDQATVRDPSMALVFRHRGGCATLCRLAEGERAMFTPPDAKVHGVLYQLADREFNKLKKSEGGGRDLMEVEVETYGGQAVKAWVFVSKPMSMLPCEVVPTEEYMRKLRDGAADQVLEPVYQAWLSSIETVSSAGLPVEYWSTPAKNAGLLALLVMVLAAGGILLHHSSVGVASLAPGSLVVATLLAVGYFA